jgi:hypothetical protein
MKSLELISFETISALLQYMFDESNFMTIEIPESIRWSPKDLTYGKVRDFLLFNQKINLVSIGVLAINLKDAREDFEPPLEETFNQNSSINRQGSVSDSDEEFSIKNEGNLSINDIYDQFISELNHYRVLVMHPYSDYKLHPRDKIIWMGEMKRCHVKRIFK